MTRKELEALIRSAVSEYIADEEIYDDNAQLCIEPSGWKVYIENSSDIDEKSPEIDFYDVMDFVDMDTETPGKWRVDEEAVASVASEYGVD